MLSSQVLRLRHELMDARAEAEHQLAVVEWHMGRISKNISCLSSIGHTTMRCGAASTNQHISAAAPTADNNPAVRSVGGADGIADFDMDVPDVVPVVLEACLTKCPKTLHDLWKEYEFGFCGCKPAKGLDCC